MKIQDKSTEKLNAELRTLKGMVKFLIVVTVLLIGFWLYAFFEGEEKTIFTTTFAIACSEIAIIAASYGNMKKIKQELEKRYDDLIESNH